MLGSAGTLFRVAHVTANKIRRALHLPPADRIRAMTHERAVQVPALSSDAAGRCIWDCFSWAKSIPCDKLQSPESIRECRLTGRAWLRLALRCPYVLARRHAEAAMVGRRRIWEVVGTWRTGGRWRLTNILGRTGWGGRNWGWAGVWGQVR
ncbi:hypothetical protein CALCODRAFT_38546 [Calocera cornea HHB12733]|uniref:Uncharacterized protein n=1 Tax=Calocera cornea HHB12733 TaxID=1353952 RepID=A0A165DX04_9BASI|nr:hypothetical protein CALCODRAFT_38546 [Calocera cornea HHB12733]